MARRGSARNKGKAGQGGARRGGARQGEARNKARKQELNAETKKQENGMVETQQHFGGIPTDADVKAIRDQYPESELHPGQTIQYVEISALIHSGKKSNRFKSVTNRWRRVVENETGIRLGAFEGTHFRVLTESEKLQCIEDKKKSMVRQTRKNLIRTAYVDIKQLSEDEKIRLNHETMNAKNMIASQQQRDPKLELPQLVAM